MRMRPGSRHGRHRLIEAVAGQFGGRDRQEPGEELEPISHRDPDHLTVPAPGLGRPRLDGRPQAHQVSDDPFNVSGSGGQLWAPCSNRRLSSSTVAAAVALWADVGAMPAAASLRSTCVSVGWWSRQSQIFPSRVGTLANAATGAASSTNASAIADIGVANLSMTTSHSWARGELRRAAVLHRDGCGRRLC